MSQRFNPRYIFKGKGHNYTCVAMTGVREDDFLRILNLCEESFAKPTSHFSTGADQHRRDQAKTIEVLRNGGYTVNNKGEITVVYERTNRQKRFQPLSIQSVESVMTTAFLEWSDAIDPNYSIQIRLRAIKSPTRNAKYAEESDGPPLSIDDQRFHYLFDVLKNRLDEPRMALYRHWKGPKRGYFGRVIDLSESEAKLRRAEANDRAEFNKRIRAMWTKRPAAIKAAAEAVAEGTK